MIDFKEIVEFRIAEARVNTGLGYRRLLHAGQRNPYQGKEADKDFKKKFLIALRAVLAVYPQAKVKQVTGGLMLMASPPPIPYKGQ
ncbi:hypothetical protein [Herbaspirillum sp. CAH-3]|uniref:hypothetical protein n=1 Tax=Herbaspirillum sp. CAH-3 TaxID=2605746 RepID=UPI001E3644BF|nr:hypothetical protein [Herbaspirillum sp. CAH-3]